MRNEDCATLERLGITPWIQKATALVGRRRRVGGNQFRHAMAAFAILIDYKIYDPVLLKSAVIHDLFEDVPETDPRAIEAIDSHGPAVLRVVRELTRTAGEPKRIYLARLRDSGSIAARTVKVADRISNLTDLHETIFERVFVERYLNETAEFVLPMARAVNDHMAVEVADLVARRRAIENAVAPAREPEAFA